jgi:hypothetical protein
MTTFTDFTNLNVSGHDGAALGLELAGTLVTATAAELNALDGILATVAELNRAADTSARLVAAGATLTLTELAHDGKIIALDTAAGSIVTLPPATGSGMRVRVVVTVTATSNSHIVKVTTDDTMVGFVHNNDLDLTPVAFYKAGGTDDTITMNRTTTGGVIGDELEFIDIKADLWLVKGAITCVAGSNIATPFSATVT